MRRNVYDDLREQLDEYSVGVPSTELGVEKTILKRSGPLDEDFRSED
ncbi:MAG: hypothetical protein RDU20_20130 [Desulfomonilaceae bacterium]|nr:hypothetical protein [Desulfomonilaceae bacterium]